MTQVLQFGRELQMTSNQFYRSTLDVMAAGLFPGSLAELVYLEQAYSWDVTYKNSEMLIVPSMHGTIESPRISKARRKQVGGASRFCGTKHLFIICTDSNPIPKPDP